MATSFYIGDFDRIRRVYGTDRGLFLLALHSFMEMHMNREMCDFAGHVSYNDRGQSIDLPFWKKAKLYGEYLAECSLSARYQSLFEAIGREHRQANRVRHGFENISEDELRAAISNFRRFCQAAGLESPVLEELAEKLEIWNERKAVIDYGEELSELHQLIEVSKKQFSISEAERSCLEKQADEAAELQRQLRVKDAQIESLEKTAGQRKEKIDELRLLRHELAAKVKDSENALARFDELEKSRQALVRLSALTRSRRDFEMHILRLSQDQSAALKAIKPDEDFLVRGSAGSGKTVVLLQALKTNIEAAAAQGDLLDRNDRAPFALLTFTRTLVKYDRYISSILDISGDEDYLLIETVDRHLLSLWKGFSQGPGRERWFGIEIIYSKDQFATARDELGDIMDELGAFDLGMDEAGMLREIDGFLWAYGISRSEYVDDMIPRSGLEGRRSAEQRSIIWDVAERFAERLEENGGITRNLACRVLLENWASVAEGGEARFRTCFIDEVQDLPPVLLAVIRKQSRHVVLAGDGAQTIYGPVSPLMRAGFDARGRSRVLRMNFRNTVPMLETAEAFREKAGIGVSSADDRPTAFRPGPPVGFFPFESDGSDVIRERIGFYRRELGYDAENICVLAPSMRVLSGLQKVFGNGLESVVVHRPEWEFAEPDGSGRVVVDGVSEFDFASSSGVRLCTLHSAKGLDFPVVLVFLPHSVRLKWMDMLSPSQADETMASLLYVALTRGLDHLEVVAGKGFGKERPEAALLEVLAEQGQGG